ncbi:MAG TPA: zf-HC2 domain-containing protein [Candidatus Limnocylindria bacterium]|nr:zf-HC2 domain-containing protein [Candidatus Limnocylindria bacterium]
MTCAEVRDLFSALVDGELSSVERAAADTHLSGCAECRRELDRFSRTVSMVGALPAERAPVGFVDRVMEAAHPVPWPRRLAHRVFVPFRVKVPMHVAAALLVATTAVWLVQRTPELQQAARQTTPAAPADTPRAAPPTVTSPPSPAPPSAVTARPPAPDTRAALKDEATAAAAPPEPEAKEHAERADAAREPESRRAEDNAGVAGAQSRAAEAPARERDSVAKQAAPPLTARALEPDVVGTWRVEDRAAVARELDPLVERLGGSPVTRRTEGSEETVEFTVPREAYDDLVNVLEWFGRLTVAPGPGPLPPTVRVRLRIIG